MLVLVRGLPGSGKSTIAKGMTGFKHFETDQFFITNGMYTFDRALIKDAHAWCQAQVRKALAEGTNVVVSNTFVKLWEMQPYFDMAAELGTEVVAVTATGGFQNIHSVPPEVLERMARNWEPTPEGYAAEVADINGGL